MIQQGYGWKYLIPMAMEILAGNPYVIGDFL
jgi:hypothetical protein